MACHCRGLYPPGTEAGPCGDALHLCRPWIADGDLLVGHDVEAPGDEVTQLPRPQKELRPCGMPEPFVAGGEGLVEENTAVRDGGDEILEDRAVEIVGHNHPTKPAIADRPGPPTLEICLDGLEMRVGAQVAEARQVPVDGDHRMPTLEEEPSVATAAARDVEDRGTGRDQRCEAFDPR
jgi:hypothetical protein